jgi:rare lipoprotein A
VDYLATTRFLDLKLSNVPQKVHLCWSLVSIASMKIRFRPSQFMLVLIALLAVNRAIAFGSEPAQSRDTVLFHRTGTASFYAARFQGKHTSNGEVLDNEAYTCASYLPYDTWLRVTHLRNGKSVLVRVTDRFRPGGRHLVDLTLRAAKDVDMVRYGIAKIRMEVLNPDFVRALLPKDSISVPIGQPGWNLLPVQKPDCAVIPAVRSFFIPFVATF